MIQTFFVRNSLQAVLLEKIEVWQGSLNCHPEDTSEGSALMLICEDSSLSLRMTT